MKLSFNVSLSFCWIILLGLFFSHNLQAQRTSEQSSTSKVDPDPKILASRNTVPSSGHDKDLMVLKVASNLISTQPIATIPDFNPAQMQTRQLNQGDASNRTTTAMALKKESPMLFRRVEATQLKPLSKTIELTVLQPIVQGQASLLLKSPYEVIFLANEAMMYRSSAIASFAAQKGKSYIVTVITRMVPDKRSRDVSLNLNYAIGGENTAISLSKTAKSSNAEPYEFQVILLAEGSGYINLDIQNEDNGGRWWFNKVEVQQVGY
ncbi:MAG: hypothetical protein R3E32_04055 [Chitinophagales bacterium]